MKSKIEINQIMELLDLSRSTGFETTFAYIAGIDDIETLSSSIKKFSRVVNRFPIINIYQFQHVKQKDMIARNADKLEYYLETRNRIEKIFSDLNLVPANWENYRSLWYHYFTDKHINC